MKKPKIPLTEGQQKNLQKPQSQSSNPPDRPRTPPPQRTPKPQNRPNS